MSEATDPKELPGQDATEEALVGVPNGDGHVEPEGIAAKGVIAMAVGTLSLIGVLIAGVVILISTTQDEQLREVGDLAAAPELEQARAMGTRLLTGYDTAEEEGRYRIPIERAMELEILERFGEEPAEAAADSSDASELATELPSDPTSEAAGANEPAPAETETQ